MGDEAVGAFDQAEKFTGAILMCPVCSTPIDATEWGHQEHDCPNCTTKFTVDLDRAKVAEHAMYGG